MEEIPDSGFPPWADKWVLPYLDDSGLWPVVAALLGHVAMLLAPLLLGVARDRNPFAIASLLIVAYFSVRVMVTDLRGRWRRGLVTSVVLGTWVLSAAVAYGAAQYGLL